MQFARLSEPRAEALRTKEVLANTYADRPSGPSASAAISHPGRPDLFRLGSLSGARFVCAARAAPHDLRGQPGEDADRFALVDPHRDELRPRAWRRPDRVSADHRAAGFLLHRISRWPAPHALPDRPIAAGRSGCRGVLLAASAF